MGLKELTKKIVDVLSMEVWSDTPTPPEGYIYFNEYLIVGENYECRKNKRKKRLDVIKKMKPNNRVFLEKYYYQKKPAYMIINPGDNLDLGVLSQGAAFALSSKHPEGKFFAYLSNEYNNSFHVKIFVYDEKKGSE